YRVTINQITDQVTLALDNANALSDVNTAGDYTVKLQIGNDGVGGGDYDGSESLVRVILDNVPTGVVVTNSGSDYLGDGKWVIVVNPAQGKMDSDTFTFDVSFQIHSSSHGAEQDITITVLNEDSDNGVNTQAS